ncbi:group I truncated hemoglobin [Haloferula rosea]|uniref:Group 1 truncated hemoglobin n=1 Tax=Haloferula rosea TaxID=490093 RepID=A0A934REZ4_9BACT|nr:group 1 truncated hemoglobin [Haloferula rosea]MBK1828418.1 group 1 truncated hemoglobin [Haloferula rosea]
MAENKPSVFERIGGEEGVERLVGKFYDRVIADPKLGRFFQHVPMEHLKTMQKEFFSEALGGPLFYTGRSLRQVHAGRGIHKEHIQCFIEHLLATLEAERADLDLDDQEVNRIYSRIAIEADRITDDVAESG